MGSAVLMSLFGTMHIVKRLGEQNALTISAEQDVETSRQMGASLQKPRNSLTESKDSRPTTIAYAISLIKCGDHQSSPEGMADAAIVLQHSVHATSVRNPKSGSKYDYKMYAIVHKQAVGCSQPLRDAGFNLVIRDSPVAINEISDSTLRKGIRREWCCGADEFIKLYSYQFKEPLVVHVDVDFVFRKPMDDLFDAMLHRDPQAMARVPRERPSDPWPTNIQAAMTRDWGQVRPGRKPGYQAGFLVVKPNQQAFEKIIDIIKHDSYASGWGSDNGWGAKGYGAFVGAMAMQGLLAYYYDVYAPDTWVELNQCRFNHMGMDVLYRAPPNFSRNHKKRGKCRNDLDYCEDCMVTPVDQIYNIHYTQCRKPWNCIGESMTTLKHKTSIPDNNVNLDHCMELQSVWHEYRRDLEAKLMNLTGDDSFIPQSQTGSYKKEFFMGHCKENGQAGYRPLAKGSSDFLKRIPELYAR